MERRRFLLLAGGALLAGCGKKGNCPEGMAEIKWDRDTCVRCNMVISDPRFAAELRGGEKDTAFKFDDIGCVAFWLKAQPWGAAAARIWVADAGSRGNEVQWLDARKAQYLGGKSSPMGYNFAAVRDAVSGGLTFDEMQAQILSKGK